MLGEQGAIYKRTAIRQNRRGSAHRAGDTAARRAQRDPPIRSIASSSIPRRHVGRSRWVGGRGSLAAAIAAIASAFAPAVADEHPAEATAAAPAEERSPVVVAQEEEQPTEAEQPQTREPGSQSSDSGIEVLKVKGRGVGSIETEVPSSMTQFDAATIQALGAEDISDLSRVTPNVNIVQPGATQATSSCAASASPTSAPTQPAPSPSSRTTSR